MKLSHSPQGESRSMLLNPLGAHPLYLNAPSSRSHIINEAVGQLLAFALAVHGDESAIKQSTYFTFHRPGDGLERRDIVKLSPSWSLLAGLW
jgi:hypothetical protein